MDDRCLKIFFFFARYHWCSALQFTKAESTRLVLLWWIPPHNSKQRQHQGLLWCVLPVHRVSTQFTLSFVLPKPAVGTHTHKHRLLAHVFTHKLACSPQRVILSHISATLCTSMHIATYNLTLTSLQLLWNNNKKKECCDAFNVPHKADSSLESAVHHMLHLLAICSALHCVVYQKSVC